MPTRESADGLPVDSAHRPDQQQPPAAISIRNVTKVFALGATAKTLKERLLHHRDDERDEFRAVNNISFDILQGETFGIVGHNGSGKSTLLKLIAGIMKPTHGEILVSGRLAALLELGAGFHPELSGRENIFLNATILGFDDEFVRQIYHEIVDFAELDDFIETPVKHYSSGMRARLGFSVATHLEPDVLLLDEILAVGDESFKRKCMERVHRFRAMDRTMVMVSHSVSTIAQLCDRAAVIGQGELLHVGNTDDAIKVHRQTLKRRSEARSEGRQLTMEHEDRVAPVRSIGSWFDDSLPEPSITPGADLRLLTEVEVTKKVKFRVRLSLRTEEGLVLLNRASTGAVGAPFDLPPGRHIVSFTLKSIPLRDGRYIADIIVESGNGKRRFDRDGSAAAFVVESGTRGLGLLAMDFGCRLVEQPAADETAPDRRRSGTDPSTQKQIESMAPPS